MAKKLILAILSNAEAVDAVSKTLIEKQYQVTQISSVGGFLRRGGATLVIGVDEAHEQPVLALLREVCAQYSKPDSHAATIFVVNASQFLQI